jgi:hypothetical protein
MAAGALISVEEIPQDGLPPRLRLRSREVQERNVGEKSQRQASNGADSVPRIA